MSHHILMDATKSSGFLGDLLKIGKFFSAASANSNMRLTQKLWASYWQMVETSHYFMMLPQFSPPWMEQNKRKLISLSLLYQIQYSQYNDFRLSADFFQRCIFGWHGTWKGLFRHKADGYYIKPHLLFTMACFRLSWDIWLTSRSHCAIF